MEEADYFELAFALHFTPKTASSDSTQINIESRLALYTTQGQIIGNVTSKSYGGITAALGRTLFNRKTDFAIGARATWYIKDCLHFLHELNFASRKDGTQDPAQMVKLSIAPALVPNGKRDVWSRPHFRLVYSVAHYNKFASENLYSPYLAQTGSKRWGHYFVLRQNGGCGNRYPSSVIR